MSIAAKFNLGTLDFNENLTRMSHLWRPGTKRIQKFCRRTSLCRSYHCPFKSHRLSALSRIGKKRICVIANSVVLGESWAVSMDLFTNLSYMMPLAKIYAKCYTKIFYYFTVRHSDVIKGNVHWFIC